MALKTFSYQKLASATNFTQPLRWKFTHKQLSILSPDLNCL